MADITIYTKPTCPYCAAAKADMNSRGVAYDEIDVLANDAALASAQGNNHCLTG
ncbi:MAG: glutaredoxin domain-containing protein [Actinomycetota bacterium]|nr:glutaredoxin domain-containing protein [Actinomycetota bacterium]